jgi:dTDP-4-amino-4,6-dideoxygalactose transaminase
MKVEFFRHNVEEADIRNAVEVLQTLFLTTGEKVRDFEERFARYLGSRHAVGVTSCTSALQMSFLALGIGPGDEVITTPMTFIATATSILHTGATPVFVDVEPRTGNIDVERIEEFIREECREGKGQGGLVDRKTGRKVKGIVPVHLYGQMCDMRRLRSIADRYRLFLVEDCAHCIEGERDGVKPGQLSEAACFSFYATKNITCGEGGAVVTNDEAIAGTLKLLRSHGMSKNAAERYTKKYDHWDMEMLGWKCNMDNIKASLLLDQLDRIEERLAARERIGRMYEEAFAEIEGLDTPDILPGTKSARHLFTIWVHPDKRDAVLGKLQEREIGVAVNFRAIHLLKYFKETYGFIRGSYPSAERIGDSTISLPLYPKLKDEEVEYVVRAMKDIIGEVL